MPSNIPEEAAQVAHVVCSVYSQAIGEPPTRGWLDLTDAQRASAVEVATAVLRGDSLEAQHDLWVAAHTAAGWVYGEAEDVERKTSPRLRPYADLPTTQEQKGVIVQAAVRAFAGGAGSALPALPAVPALAARTVL